MLKLCMTISDMAKFSGNTPNLQTLKPGLSFITLSRFAKESPVKESPVSLLNRTLLLRADWSRDELFLNYENMNSLIVTNILYSYF